MHANKRFQSAFTLVELMVAVAIVSIATTVAVPAYGRYITNARVKTVIVEIAYIEGMIDRRYYDNGTYPNALAEVFATVPLDPWGNEYRYLRISGGDRADAGRKRKDRVLVPINSDYDLYSMGSDGLSVAPLTARHSRDDIVRANNGEFIGLADDY